MANNPIQIVLNTQNYVSRWNRAPGGGNKDFYAGNDQEFIRHKKELISQLDELQGEALTSDSSIIYAQVELQSDALAKSHRPVEKVFDDKSQLYIGGGRLGSIFIEMTKEEIPLIQSRIESAEEETNWVPKGGKLEAKPTRIRSEVGAIQSVRNYSASDRRKFSVDAAIEWLRDPRTGGAYYLETFITPESVSQRADDASRRRGYEALRNFEDSLKSLNLPINISSYNPESGTGRLYILQPTAYENATHQQLTDIHERLLSFLDSQPIVRSIMLPPILQATRDGGEKLGEGTIPPPDSSQQYPVVGIIDSGISDHKALSPWKVGGIDFLSTEGQDCSHGTFIAGLACSGNELNPYEPISNEKCKFFDLGLHPTGSNVYTDYYPRGFIDFLEQLDAEIPEAKSHGVRVFNMSLAVTTPVADDGYSIFAELIDSIADKHDVVFVLPAGNLTPNYARHPWPDDADSALAMLATYRFAGQDRVYQPADSIRAVVVGATNPPDDHGKIYPAQYTRRGPGPALGAKPDIAHVGGGMQTGTGLISLDPSGTLVEDRGTSYASPLAARTISSVDHLIEGRVSTETLIALAIHHSNVPETLGSKKIEPIACDFVGAGIPESSDQVLLLGEHEITMVFDGILYDRNQMLFQFSWPPSLVTDQGKCRGAVELTLVYSPPIDRSFGGEFVRVNLDAYLRQEQINIATGESKFQGRLTSEQSKRFEKELIEHGAKWWPVKRRSKKFSGKGNSSQWRLVVSPLARSHYRLPEDGVPFAALLTIRDTDGTEPVFSEMRQELRSSGVVIEDIRTALSTQIRR